MNEFGMIGPIAVFTFELFCLDRVVVRAEGVPDGESAGCGGRDNGLVLAESVIQSAGYETVSAASLSEAQSLVSSADSHLDLVFTDISLGDDPEGGVQIGHLVRQQRPATPVLYTSGRNLTDGLKEMLVARSVFLPKPYTDT